MHRLVFGLYSHPKEFWRMESELMLTPRENPLYRNFFPERRIEPTTLHQAGQRAQRTTNEIFGSPFLMATEETTARLADRDIFLAVLAATVQSLHVTGGEKYMYYVSMKSVTAANPLPAWFKG